MGLAVYEEAHPKAEKSHRLRGLDQTSPTYFPQMTITSYLQGNVAWKKGCGDDL